MSVREFVSLHADEWAVVDVEGQSPRASTRGVSSKILPDAALSGCFDHSDWSGAILSCRAYLMRPARMPLASRLPLTGDPTPQDRTLRRRRPGQIGRASCRE